MFEIIQNSVLDVFNFFQRETEAELVLKLGNDLFLLLIIFQLEVIDLLNNILVEVLEIFLFHFLDIVLLEFHVRVKRNQNVLVVWVGKDLLLVFVTTFLVLLAFLEYIHVYIPHLQHVEAQVLLPGVEAQVVIVEAGLVIHLEIFPVYVKLGQILLLFANLLFLLLDLLFQLLNLVLLVTFLHDGLGDLDHIELLFAKTLLVLQLLFQEDAESFVEFGADFVDFGIQLLQFIF